MSFIKINNQNNNEKEESNINDNNKENLSQNNISVNEEYIPNTERNYKK